MNFKKTYHETVETMCLFITFPAHRRSSSNRCIKCNAYKLQPTIYLVVSVDVGELPLVTGDAHPFKFCHQVDELPPFLSLLVVLFGVVGECIELLIGYCTKEKGTRERALTKTD